MPINTNLTHFDNGLTLNSATRLTSLNITQQINVLQNNRSVLRTAAVAFVVPRVNNGECSPLFTLGCTKNWTHTPSATGLTVGRQTKVLL